jgi:hypothetical protein
MQDALHNELCSLFQELSFQSYIWSITLRTKVLKARPTTIIFKSKDLLIVMADRIRQLIVISSNRLGRLITTNWTTVLIRRLENSAHNPCPSFSTGASLRSNHEGMRHLARMTRKLDTRRIYSKAQLPDELN